MTDTTLTEAVRTTLTQRWHIPATRWDEQDGPRDLAVVYVEQGSDGYTEVEVKVHEQGTFTPDEAMQFAAVLALAAERCRELSGQPEAATG